jgi:Fe-S-cluster containining protein
MECKRCGTCCEKGGPVLHLQDLDFLQNGIVSLEQLLVIRKGELAFNPFNEQVEPAPVEMLKLAGEGTSWECPFHRNEDGLSSCLIHADRPLECRLLKCWDTAAIEKVTFKDCLSRFDLIGTDHDIRSELVKHENECSYQKLWQYANEVKNGDLASLAPVQKILSRDLHIRRELIGKFRLTLAQELFYCGQPMFQVVRNEEFSVSFSGDELRLQFRE